MRLFTTGLVAVLSVLLFPAATCADLFGSGANSFTIDFVTIGAPNNPQDYFIAPGDVAAPPGGGSVPYVFRMGTYEVSERMIAAANAEGNLGITQTSRGPDFPAGGISWLDAVRFVNWLNTSTGNPAAYKLDPAGNFQLWAPTDPGYDPTNWFRNTQAKYFLPSHDEWYKAAYFDPLLGVYYDYPTGSDTAPLRVAGGTAPGTAVYGGSFFAPTPSPIMSAGGPSPFGTFAQGGNIGELIETEIDKVNDSIESARTARGGAYTSGAAELVSYTAIGYGPNFQSPNLGFRVASRIPEPSTLSLAIGLLWLAGGVAKRTARVSLHGEIS
ncbi:MAG: SUMF1/EgtB/PvdO family nonheme iron enzyme [Pirellulales bacterium]|nr:SUMF1/EgtB/PvdO family nonheme iron enzyme [Pirellulales bacterium]